jgi:hypothetical protein
MSNHAVVKSRTQVSLTFHSLRTGNTGAGALAFWTALALIFLPACRSHPPLGNLPPVGPAPTEGAKQEGQGYLVVYSAWSNFVDQGSIGHHSRINLSSEDGSNSRDILNYADRFDEGPIRIPLAPGAYRVRARSAHFGKVTVPVVIRPRQTTFVSLDGGSHADAPPPQAADVVRLPNGEVVGWSASAASRHAP